MTPKPRWGGHTLQLQLPTGSVRFLGLSSGQHASINDYYLQFIGGIAQGEIEDDLVCSAYRLEDLPVSDPQALSIDGQYAPRQIRHNNGIEIIGFNFIARMELQRESMQASLSVVHEHDLPRAGVIENFLRIYTAHHALLEGGVVLHSAGLVFDGQAYIFAGRSNAGKTTLTRKAHQKGARVLSDDINLLLPGTDGFRGFAVPFTGEFGRTLDHPGGRDSYPVAGVVLLEQGERLGTTTIKASEAVARLLIGCPFVNTDAEETATLFDVLSELVARVPVIALRSRRDDKIEAIMHTVKRRIGHA